MFQSPEVSADLRLSTNAIFVFFKDGVVAFNKNNGSWIRFPKECFDYLDKAISERFSSAEFLQCFEDIEDREYIRVLIEKLREIKVIVSSSEIEEEKYNKLNNINLMFTNRCNLSCKHCATNALVSNKEYFNTEEMKEILDKIMESRPEVLVITGGEPLMRNDFVELIHYIHDNSDISLNLMTNATLITPKIAAEIAKCIKSVDISLDGYDEASCNHVRGGGVFNRVLSNIKLLQDFGAEKISLSMVSLHNDLNEEEKFRKLCKDLGVFPAIRHLNLVGRAKENIDYLEKEAPILEEQIDIGELPSLQQLRKSLKAGFCQAGITNLSIEVNGDIIPCSTFEQEKITAGNIKDIENLNQYINSEEFKNSCGMKKFMEYSPYGDKLCNHCEVRHFCWTCPFSAIEVFHNRNNFDDYCKKRKKYLFHLVWGESFESD